MSTTTIKVHISAADSIKNACQCGWQRIQIDFSTWTQAEREYLATRVKDDEGASLDVSIAPPTSEQLQRWVTDQLAAIQRKRDEEKAQGPADIEAVKARLVELRALPTESLESTHDVSRVTGYNTVRASTALRAIGIESLKRGGAVEPSQFGRGDDWTQRLADDAAKKAERDIRNAEINAAAEARKVATETEYDALYARLPEEMRIRDDAGYLADAERILELRKLIRGDAGLPPCERWQHKDTLGALTAEQFAALQVAIKAAPEGASVTPCTVYDGGGYRKATEDNDEDDVDSDGEVAIERENERARAVIKWTRGGIECTSQMPLE